MLIPTDRVRHMLFLRSVLILYSHLRLDLPSGLLSSAFVIKSRFPLIYPHMDLLISSLLNGLCAKNAWNSYSCLLRCAGGQISVCATLSEQTAIISLYNINWLVFITETAFAARYGLDLYTQFRLILNSSAFVKMSLLSRCMQRCSLHLLMSPPSVDPAWVIRYLLCPRSAVNDRALMSWIVC